MRPAYDTWRAGTSNWVVVPARQAPVLLTRFINSGSDISKENKMGDISKGVGNTL